MAMHDVNKKISRLEALIAERIPTKKAADLKSFAKTYYSNVAPEDIIPLSDDDIYGAVLSHWNFCQRRKPGEIKIRVFNPTIEEHGWQSSHTIIEVVLDDMPFLVQSIIMAVNRFNLTNHWVIHPVYQVRRSNSGKLIDLNSESAEAQHVSEAFIHVEVDRQSNPDVLRELIEMLDGVLNDVKVVNEDWSRCRGKVAAALDQIKQCSPNLSEQQLGEVSAFLTWLSDDHFVFLGYREYELATENRKKGFRIVPGSGLGILRDEHIGPGALDFVPLFEDAYRIICQPDPLLITKATTQSTVHRPAFMDYVGVRRFNKAGKVIGEIRFLGLYDSSAYSSSLEVIPVLKRKISEVFQRAGFSPSSHNGRSLMYVLRDLPRDELYHSDEETLYQYAIGVMQLQERQRVRVFARQDIYGQFVSVLVFVPRERFETDLRKRIHTILMDTFEGKSSEFRIQLSESLLARIHFIIHTGPRCSLEFDTQVIEQKIVGSLYQWGDDFKDSLHTYFGEEHGNHLLNRYGQGISAAYREDFSPRVAALDIERIEALGDSDVQMRLYQTLEQQGNLLRFKLYNSGDPAPLSKTLPMLENMGVTVVDERPYILKRQDIDQPVWIHDFGLVYDGRQALDVDALKNKFQENFEQIWFGRVENDGFNKLVLVAQLDWRQLTVLRAVYFYLRQIRMTFSRAYVEDTLANNSSIARLLIEYFEVRFKPDVKDRDGLTEKILGQIENEIDQVVSLDEDRILRRFLDIFRAILRTNYYQFKSDAAGIPYMSIKLDPALIPGIPSPRPSYEIFVYSPRVEGVHLRGGQVARGGLRWSDRREDFRTEILGLMKAQVAKNSVIVPTGAKGGFVAKRLASISGEETLRQEVVDCYRVFIQGLLDITDNLSAGETIKPNNVVCFDGDDPYLVVAADKGTATFSDLANEIALEYGFWLGDAFASGGSVGYDHKKMGITAKGAWESVKHHFLELGIDVQTSVISVIGIGDMSGDVFGNGMLLSDKIHLLAAFNHKHIFLDPTPNAEKSFAERKRLFDKPRSSWFDYDQKLLSKGGGIYSRDAKSIRLNAEIKSAFSIDAQQLTPNELIQALLRSPVDLIWNGGIGTYVKAAEESDIDVGDRANDAVRVDGKDLKCKVIGEGGNLGLTQLGRLECAFNGVRINTDSIDNSAGVDCSDHEVNIKILLNQIVENGDLTTKQRNKLLESMTEEVSRLVLSNNYQQNRAISMIQSHSEEFLDAYRRVIDILEQSDWLDRSLEFIPENEELEQRKVDERGLLRPEISVLLAYCKIMLKDSLLKNSAIFSSEYSQRELSRYFPLALQDKFCVQIREHRLMREIIANQLINGFVNRLGVAFPYRVMDETGVDIAEVMRSFSITYEIFGAENLWNEIEKLDERVARSLQKELTAQVTRLVERSMYWLIRNAIGGRSTSEVIAAFKPGLKTLSGQLLKILPELDQSAACRTVEDLICAGVPQKLAKRIACLNSEFACLDIIAVAGENGRSLKQVSQMYFALDQRFQWNWLQKQIGLLPRDNHWQSLARTALRDDFHRACRLLTTDAIHGQGSGVGRVINEWFELNRGNLSRYDRLLSDIRNYSDMTIEQASVLLKELYSFASVACGSV